jgi:hypothetical protein
LLRLRVLRDREKFGNDCEAPDRLAREITDHVGGRSSTTRRTSAAAASARRLNSIDHCLRFGEATGALPDGRHAHEPLSKNLSAVTGMDRDGVTALINSVTRIDFTQFPNGSVLDLVLHPSAVQGEAGLDALVGLIRGYFAQGGFGVQFNIFDAETLREAQQHPERHANAAGPRLRLERALRQPQRSRARHLHRTGPVPGVTRRTGAPQHVTRRHLTGSHQCPPESQTSCASPPTTAPGFAPRSS